MSLAQFGQLAQTVHTIYSCELAQRLKESSHPLPSVVLVASLKEGLCSVPMRRKLVLEIWLVTI